MVHPRVELPSTELPPPSSRDGPSSDTTEWSPCNATPGVIFQVKISGTCRFINFAKAENRAQNTAGLAIYLTQGLRSEHVNKWSFFLHLGFLVPPLQIPEWTPKKRHRVRGEWKECSVTTEKRAKGGTLDTRDRTLNADFGLRGLLPGATSVSKRHKQTKTGKKKRTVFLHEGSGL